MDKILVIGDSHTLGTGLKDVNNDYPWFKHSNFAWPYKIFSKNNVINRSYPGMCNDLMLYELCNYVDTVKFVVIMFSYPERHHIIDNGYNFNVSHNYSDSYSENGNENWVGIQINKKRTNDFKRLTVDMYSDELNEIQYFRNILFCQNLCISKNIEYAFTTVTNRPLIRVNGTTKKIRDNLYQQINKDNFFLIEKKYGFDDYAFKINAKKGLDNKHWDEEYHQMFANLFYQYLKEDRKLTKILV
jgi:hypothetical protein